MASQLPGLVAPGEIITLIGSGIGSASSQPTGVSTDLFDGTPAPVLYADENDMRVMNDGLVTAELTLSVAAASPAILTADGSGTGQGAILNQDLTLNSPLNPGSVGSVVAIYATGAGKTNPPGVDGDVAASPSTPLLPITVKIGGLDAQVLYAGSAPGLISGVLQVNCVVPEGLPSGPALPVIPVLETMSSPADVTIAIH